MNISNLNLPPYEQNVLIRMLTRQGVDPAELYELIRAYAQLFPCEGDTPPLDDMERLLDRDGAIQVIPAERVAREWCALKIRDTAAYHIVVHLGATSLPPDEESIHNATTALLARLVETQDDTESLKHMMALLRRNLKNVTPDEVGHVWWLCQTYGITPWLPLEKPLFTAKDPRTVN
ncbi:MAG: hypothetical protein DI585_00370 [Pseudomonas fluorescens]|nr:MAG: hypothetical protein DI585_00370 [Pseudomonas fluorescens]